MARPGAWAWGICWLMFASTVLSYLDRQAVTLVRPYVEEEFGLRSLADFGWLIAAFQLTYAVFQVPAGYLTDRSNVRLTYALAVGCWSAAAVAMAFVPTLGLLIFCRAVLGLWESFNWPCALRVTSRILPPQDRSLGNGIFNSGAAIGAVLTPLIVTPLTLAFGWRVAFFLVGALGALWVPAWLLLFDKSKSHSFKGRQPTPPRSDLRLWTGLPAMARIAFAGVALASTLIALSGFWMGLRAIWWGIASLMLGILIVPLLLPRSTMQGAEWSESLGEVVRSRRFWVLVVVSVSVNVCWHFQISWLPTYFRDFRKMSFLSSGLLSAVPFLAADLGNLGGGALSRWLVSRGWNAVSARRLVMTVCTILIATGLGVSGSDHNTVVIVLLACMALGTAAFMANYFAFTQEVLPRHTGLIVGILGGLGNLFAAGFHPVAGWLADETHSFAPIFLITSLLPILGIVSLWWSWDDPSAAAEGAS
jgi:ACS family hexuronate transporter-like MFS transporter